MAKTTVQFTEDQYEIVKSIIEQVASNPELLGLKQSEVDEIYDIIFT